MNKFLILTAAFLFIFSLSRAQTEKGTQTAGLNLAFSSLQSSSLSIDPSSYAAYNGNAKTTIFNAGPQYSYFIADQLDLAFSFSYNSTVTTPQNSNPNIIEPGRESSKELDVQAGIRKYLLHKNKLNVRVGAYLGYGHQETVDSYSTPGDSYANMSNYPDAGLSLELVYYPLKNLGFSARLANVQYERFKENDGSRGYGSGSNFNFSLISQGLSVTAFYAFGSKG